MNNTQIGRKGEEIAKKFLQEKNYEILAQNYRYLKGEIDIIAKKDNVIVFVEVKLRKNHDFGFPEQSITPKKILLLKQTANFFLEELQWNGNISFDIIAITTFIKKNTENNLFYQNTTQPNPQTTKNNIEIVHFEDCF